MTEIEKFKYWLKTDFKISSDVQYATGINALSKILGLKGEGIFAKDIDIEDIARRVKNLPNLQKDYSSHFNAYLKYKAATSKLEIDIAKVIFRQPDIFKRQQVEIAAIQKTIMHFENIGYKIKSVERENVGWDLEAVNLQHKLFLEVKGLSGKTMTIELSSNEYSKSKITENYKICIVTNSLISPILNIFTYDKEKQKWANEKGQSLLLRENISAILSVEK